jgi:hypothetical protein
MTDREAFARFMALPREIIEPWVPPGWHCLGSEWAYDVVNIDGEPEGISTDVLHVHLAALTGRLAVWMYDQTALSLDDLTGDLLPALVAAFEEMEDNQ